MQYGPPIPFESFETKAVVERDEFWTISGYASVFGNRDLGGDVVVEGAFAKSLRDHGMPALLFNHQMGQPPLGVVVDAKEHKRGLWIKAELPRDDTFVSGRIIPQLKKRGLKGMSIGYQVLEKEHRNDARYLKQIRLFEVSVVNTPMNPLAAVETVKSFDRGRLDLTLEEVAQEMQRLARMVRGG